MNFIMLASSNPLDISEFAKTIIDFITKDLFLEGLRKSCIAMYTSIFSQANEAVETASSELLVTPEAIFPGVYEKIIEISETAFMPVAGIVLACILSYECVSMMAESNRMKEFGPQDVFILILKALAGVLLLSHSADLVNTCFKVGQWAVARAGLETGSALESDIGAIELIENSMNAFAMTGYLILGCVIKAGIGIFSIAIRIAVWLRFVELYMFVVSAPIPFATFLNKEWGQVGFNYIRKILSLAFQPVYMIICFSIFSGTLTMQSGNSFFWALIKSFAAMVILVLALFKTSSIADSIFNAH